MCSLIKPTCFRQSLANEAASRTEQIQLTLSHSAKNVSDTIEIFSSAVWNASQPTFETAAILAFNVSYLPNAINTCLGSTMLLEKHTVNQTAIQARA